MSQKYSVTDLARGVHRALGIIVQLLESARQAPHTPKSEQVIADLVSIETVLADVREALYGIRRLTHNSAISNEAVRCTDTPALLLEHHFTDRITNGIARTLVRDILEIGSVKVEEHSTTGITTIDVGLLVWPAPTVTTAKTVNELIKEVLACTHKT